MVTFLVFLLKRNERYRYSIICFHVFFLKFVLGKVIYVNVAGFHDSSQLVFSSISVYMIIVDFLCVIQGSLLV